MFINWKLKASFLSITRIPRYRTRIFALNATESSKPWRYMCHEWFDTASTVAFVKFSSRKQTIQTRQSFAKKGHDIAKDVLPVQKYHVGKCVTRIR